MVRHYLLIWALDLAAGDQAIASLLVAQGESRLRVLLNDLYPDSNLPMVLRSQSPSPLELERDLMFVGVAYRLHSGPTAPLMFRNPNASLALAMAFSQNFLFLPHPRFTCCPWGETRVDPRSGNETFIPYTDGWPKEWDASSQNWQAKLVPATARSISSILSSSPPQGLMNRPNWGPLSPRQIDALTHRSVGSERCVPPKNFRSDVRFTLPQRSSPPHGEASIPAG